MSTLRNGKAIIFNLDVLTKSKTECEDTRELFIDLSASQFPALHKHLSLSEIQKLVETSLIVFNACVEQTIIRNHQSPSFAVIAERALSAALKRSASIEEITEVAHVLSRMLDISFSRRYTACLIALQRSGYMLGLVANSPLPAYSLADDLEDIGIVKRFETIITSSDSGVFKPNESIFRMAIESMYCDERDVIIVGSNLERDIAPVEHFKSAKVFINNYKKRQRMPKNVLRISSLEELPYLNLDKLMKSRRR
jgi:FMN phosphatase YigB (HAD superfamily)